MGTVSITNKDKWKVASHVIKSKKSIDSLIYINDNYDELKRRRVNISESIASRSMRFYINCAIVIDKYIDSQPLSDNGKRRFRKKLKRNHNEIDDVFYRRNKHCAHDDSDYIHKNFNSILEIINDMKSKLQVVKNVCQDVLPECLTLDYCSFDNELYQGPLITPYKSSSLEDAFKERGVKINGDPDNINEEDINNLNLGSVFMSLKGRTSAEDLQIRQDSYIERNIAYGGNMWEH